MPGTVSEVSATLVASTTRRVQLRLAPVEHPVLLGGGQPRVQRQHLEPVAPGQQVGGVADLALAGQEHQDVAGALGGQLVDRVADGLALVAVLVALAGSTGR